MIIDNYVMIVLTKMMHIERHQNRLTNHYSVLLKCLNSKYEGGDTLNMLSIVDPKRRSISSVPKEFKYHSNKIKMPLAIKNALIGILP